MKPISFSLPIAVVAFTGLMAQPLQAADLAPAPAEPAAPITLTDQWKFQLTAYGWATALNGDVGIRGLPPVSVDVTFADILKNLKGGFMGSFYASNGRWMVLTDLIWAKLSADATFGVGGIAKFTQTQAIASGIVGYRLPFGPENLNVSATAGVRYNYLKAEVDIRPGRIPISINRDASKSWVDPVVGLAMRYDFNESWFVNVLGDVGGFGVGSKFTTQGFAAVGYNWSKSISTSLGYRVIYTDYEKGGFTYKVTQHGVFSGIAYHF